MPGVCLTGAGVGRSQAGVHGLEVGESFVGWSTVGTMALGEEQGRR